MGEKVISENPAKYIIVMEHYQWFYATDGRTSQYARWHDLFDECGVDLAIAGNNHIYARTNAIYHDAETDGTTGTVYLQTPSSDNERGQATKEWTDNKDKIKFIWSEGPQTVGALLMHVADSKRYVKPLKTYDMESIINSHIPEFKVQAYHNGKFETVTDKDVLGKWAVFFFYPADFTFVCPTELEDMADKYEDFKRLGVEVYSVSTDSHFVHKAWHDASDSIKKIQYPMLADPTGLLTRAFGVMIEEDGMAYRGTFVSNPEGIIKLVEIQDNSIGRNAEELLRRVEAAQFVATHDGEVCPAKWKQGQATLKPSIDLVGKI